MAVDRALLFLPESYHDAKMSLDKLDLTGRVAIVIGVGRSIGRGIALGFSGSGSNVVLSGL